MLVGYMRVSSENERQTLDLQHDALIHAGVDPRHIYQDKASGARDDRKGLQQALDYLKAGDCLVVWKLDRLGRSLSHLVTIVEEFKKKGIAFKSLTEQMDTTTPHGEFFFGIFGSLAQYERALTKERIMAGPSAARKRGKRGGRPRAISEEKMRAISEALNSGTSKAAVCRTFYRKEIIYRRYNAELGNYEYSSGYGAITRHSSCKPCISKRLLIFGIGWRKTIRSQMVYGYAFSKKIRMRNL
jgi:DNA invertase Pin-like site-specific DNA recombinase